MMGDAWVDFRCCGCGDLSSVRAADLLPRLSRCIQTGESGCLLCSECSVKMENGERLPLESDSEVTLFPEEPLSPREIGQGTDDLSTHLPAVLHSRIVS